MSEKKKLVGNINVLFDRVSGKERLEMEIDRLQSHVVELEIDVKRLNTQLEKRETTAKQAVAAKQEAEEGLNAANTRIETLQHELESAKQEAQGKIGFRSIEDIPPAIMPEYLFQIGSIRSVGDNLLTAYLAPHQSLLDLMDAEGLSEHIDEDVLSLLERVDSPTGLAFFYDTRRMVCEIVAPSLPIMDVGWGLGNSFDVGKLKDVGEKDVNICVILMHAGESFVGFASDRNEFDSHNVIRSSVKAKHTKGGFSQRRFERLREEDIAHHVDKVRDCLKEMLGEMGEPELIIAGGDFQLVKHVCNGIVDDIPVIEKTMESRIDKSNVNLILRNALSSRRYQI